MTELVLNLDYLKINKFGTAEIRNEVYLVTIGADLSGIGGHRAPDGMFPDGFAKKHDFMLIGVSPLFENVRRGEPLNLLGDGLNLYGPKDPGGKLCFHTAIMESDRDHRDIATRIGQAVRGSGLADALDMVSGSNHWVRAVTIIARYVFERVLYFLKLDDDDVIDTFHYSSTERPGRGYACGHFGFGHRNVDGWMTATQNGVAGPLRFADIADPDMVDDDNPYGEDE